MPDLRWPDPKKEFSRNFFHTYRLRRDLATLRRLIGPSGLPSSAGLHRRRPAAVFLCRRRRDRPDLRLRWRHVSLPLYAACMIVVGVDRVRGGLLVVDILLQEDFGGCAAPAEDEAG